MFPKPERVWYEILLEYTILELEKCPPAVTSTTALYQMTSSLSLFVCRVTLQSVCLFLPVWVCGSASQCCDAFLIKITSQFCNESMQVIKNIPWMTFRVMLINFILVQFQFGYERLKIIRSKHLRIKDNVDKMSWKEVLLELE